MELHESAATTGDPPVPMPSVGEMPPVLPPVPRPITRQARLRSWNELPVRVWVILTVVVALVAGYVTTTRVREALNDRWLVLRGLDVKAKVLKVDGYDHGQHRWPRAESRSVVLSFTTPDGRQHELSVRLDAKPDAYVQVGGELPIKVDPDDPERRWTEITEPQPWSAELTTPAMLIPLALVLAGVALVRRQNVLRVWKLAPLVAGVVVDTQHTALAPFSLVVRFAKRDGEDRRVFRTLMPAKAGIPARGQIIWLICPPTKPHRAIVAGLYL